MNNIPSIPQTIGSWLSLVTPIIVALAFILNLSFGQKQDSADTAKLNVQLLNLQVQVIEISKSVAHIEGELDVMAKQEGQVQAAPKK